MTLRFQDKEYKSKVLALVADIQKSSSFQSEIIENENLRNRELSHLRDLEHQCAELLGQANLTLEGFSERTGIDYKTYESLVGEANKWYQFQQILLEVMCRISDLTYTLNLGSISRENSSAMCIPYSKQASAALIKLKSWHQDTGERLAIDVDAERRRRQGIGGFFMNLPALFNDDWHYKPVQKRTVKMIRNQSSDVVVSETVDDLFNSDVQIIAKDGKLFYLPSKN